MKIPPLAIRTITIDCDEVSNQEIHFILDNLETIDWEKIIRDRLGNIPGLRISVEE